MSPHAASLILMDCLGSVWPKASHTLITMTYVTASGAQLFKARRTNQTPSPHPVSEHAQSTLCTFIYLPFYQNAKH